MMNEEKKPIYTQENYLHHILKIEMSGDNEFNDRIVCD